MSVTIVPEGQLVYGMQLQVQSKSKTFVEPWEADAGRDELVAIAQQADRSGFFYIAVCDHLAVTKPLDAHMGATWYDTVATLGYLGALTQNVRLLSHVYVLAYRHPLATAKAFMTLDELSGGRAILGVGAGHLEGEFDLLGLDFAGRGKVTDDAVDVVRAAFTDEYPDVVTDTYGHIKDGAMGPRPVQPRIPIWIGGSSKAALRRVAAKGDGWLPQGTPRADMPGQIAYVREQREALGGGAPIDIGTISEFLYVGDPGWDVGPNCISGSPDLVAEKTREWKDMGVDHVQVRFRNRSLQELLDQMEAFGTDVAPHLNS